MNSNIDRHIELAAATLAGQMSTDQLVDAWHTAYEGTDMTDEIQVGLARLKRRWVARELTVRGVQFVAGEPALEG